MKKIRLLHRYLGLFFSPAILFFTFSGVIQTFNLQSANKECGICTSGMDCCYGADT